MLDPWKRWVQFHELYLKSTPEEAPKINLNDLLPLWEKRIKSKEAVKLINKETAAIRIVDVRHDKKKNILALLFQYTDQNVTDPAFSHLKTGELRVEPKLEGEGIAVSAHALISLKAHDPEGLLYQFLLEEIPGLGRSRLSDFIRSELKEVSQGVFEYKDPDANNALKKYYPAAELLGTPSKNLTEEIENGCVIQSIELVKFSKGSSKIDEEGFYVESSRLLKLVPDKGVSIRKLWPKIKKLAKKDAYNDIKFRYKHPAGKQKTATMNGAESDIVDALVLRSETVLADEVLEQCSKNLVTSMVSGMSELLTNKS